MALTDIETAPAPADDWLCDGPPDAPLTVVLAHGAGAPMDSDFMAAFAEGLAGHGHRVVRFEFPYMARRRREGRPCPPNRPDVLLDAWRAVLDALPPRPVVIGGKSMGGRMATMIAADPAAAGRVRGVVCLGYPFHPPGRPERTRTGHLSGLTVPTLIVQGTRDPFGNADEVAGYALAPVVRVCWIPDGGHGFDPPARSPHTTQGNRALALDAVAGFLADLEAGP
jgi:hypothetical protein